MISPVETSRRQYVQNLLLATGGVSGFLRGPESASGPKSTERRHSDADSAR